MQRPTELRPQGREVYGDCLDAPDTMLADLQVRQLRRVVRRAPGALAGRLPRRGLVDRQPKLARERQIDHRGLDGNVEQRRKRASPSQEDPDDDLVLDQAEANAAFSAHRAPAAGWAEAATR